jgi:DNA helicase-2/ATP-dependent DNA helicase PcrA
MTERYAVVGPPGTGKTTYLKHQVERAAQVYGASGVLACSLTRAAAAELRGRAGSIPPDRFGTLHSFAFRQLGAPEVAEANLDEWNAACPAFALSPSKGKKAPDKDDADDAHVSDGPGDDLHNEMELNRHHMMPEDAWRSDVRGFARKWREWLADSGRMDFTGMIESALASAEYAPGQPEAMFVDEAQDMSRLEIALVRKWSADVRTLVAVGDPCQAINTFRGADPDAFFDVGDVAHRRVLAQSYRVPVKVHAAACKWANGMLAGIEYRPTEIAGEIGRTSASMRYVGGVVEELERDLDSHSGTVLFQAQAGYMLRPLLAVLRQRGIPFHNPNRLKDGSWNPLARRARGTSTVDRIAAWLKRDQTLADVQAWLHMIRVKGVLAKGAKERPLTAEHQIPELFVSEEAMAGAFSGDPKWLAANVTAEYQKRLDYPLAIWKRYGEAALKAVPRLVVGTIHSMKGAEADSVWLSPDLSPKAWEQFVTVSGDDARRLFYVGMTRARHRLTILDPAGRRAACLT